MIERISLQGREFPNCKSSLAIRMVTAGSSVTSDGVLENCISVPWSLVLIGCVAGRVDVVVESEGFSRVSGDGCKCLVDSYKLLYTGSGVGDGTVGCFGKLGQNFTRTVTS